MRNHKKLYRSIAASLLMLLTGLVVAPTVVTAGYQASTKKVDTPSARTEHATPQSTAPQIAQLQQSSRATALTAPIWPAHCPRPLEQTEHDSTGRSQPDAVGPTTFAIADFEPTQDGGTVPPRGSAGVEIAAADAGGSNISKVAHKPNPPKPGTDESGKGPHDTTGAPDNKPSDSHPAAGGDQKDHPAADADLPPKTELVGNGDNHDNRPHASVPEPSSLGLLAVGIVGLALARRRG